MFDDNRRIGVAIYTPMPMTETPDGRKRLEPITVEWHRARKNLAMPTNWNYIEFQLDGMEVGEARCEAVRALLRHTPRPTYLLSVDYDVLIPWDALQKLVYRAACYPDFDIYAGVYVCKGPVPEPLIYKGDGVGGFWDWTLGDLLFDMTGVHQGLTLIRSSFLAELSEKTGGKPLFKTDHGSVSSKDGALTHSHGTEDLFFCQLARETLGHCKILVDTSVLAGHINNHTGVVYGLPEDSPPIRRAKWFHGNGKEQKDAETPLKLALDIGAGGERRQWEGYRTETLDIRPETKPDYVMDLRWLNLPDEHFDMLASSHSLEHVGRWDQERVWSEMFRILKPGGTVEHVVPNLEWAAWHIADKNMDADVMNVIFGAQEAHGDWGKTWNVHFFGYTPSIARALAEGSGLVDVEVKTYLEDESLGYNLVLTGKKPEAAAAKADEPEDGD